ncbi:MAG: S9 family peptidase [Ahniella sp.]|nr:S9 family peptidase [Ahniella sp.]
MKIKTLLATLALTWAGLVFAGEQIPLKDFFDHRQFVSMQVSPDGENIAFTYEEGTEVKLAVMNLADKKILSSFGFGEQMHVLNFYWGNNERVLMSVGKVTGNLDNLGRPAHLYAANIDGSKRRQIFEMQRSGYRLLSLLPDDDKFVLIAKNHWADGGVDRVHKLNIYDGNLQFLASEQPELFNPYSVIADNKGKVRIAVEFIEGKDIDSHQTVIHARDGDIWNKVSVKSVRQQPQFEAIGFSADNQTAYFASDFDMATDARMGVFSFDFNSSELKLIHRDDEVDITTGIYGHDGEVLGVFADKGRGERLYFTSKAQDSKFVQSLEAAFKGQDVSVTSYTDDGKKAIVITRSDRNPGEFYLFEVETMKAKFLAAALPKLKADQLAEMEPVTIAARDGLKMHAMLTRPNDQKTKLPLIVNVHGGPFGPYDRWQYFPEAQFFANRGYATLQVNYRGSGNRGKDFMDKGRRQWGLLMQDDVTDATKWAIEQGIADPERICIYGGSYGGYATLAGVIKEPDLYKCGVGYVGVYDMIWFRQGDGSDGDRGGSEQKKMMNQWSSAYIGDDLEALRKVSPVHNVSRIKAELFIVHGSNDVRVPVGHYDRLKKALDGIGKDYEEMVKPEGHGFYQIENRVALYTKMYEFFEKHIGAKKPVAAD